MDCETKRKSKGDCELKFPRISTHPLRGNTSPVIKVVENEISFPKVPDWSSSREFQVGNNQSKTRVWKSRHKRKRVALLQCDHEQAAGRRRSLRRASARTVDAAVQVKAPEEGKDERKLKTRIWTRLTMRKVVGVLHPRNFPHTDRTKGFEAKVGGEIITFDVNEYKRRGHSGNPLSMLRRSTCILLLKFPERRTLEDIRNIHFTIQKMGLFNVFRPKLQLELARVLVLCDVKHGTVIIRQGQQSCYIYYILRGFIAVTKTINLPDGSTDTYHMGILSGGDSFGEVSLTENPAARVTLTCIGDTQLLKLNVEDCNKCLQGEYINQFAAGYKAIHTMDFFKGWRELDLEETYLSSKTETFEPHKLVFRAQDTLKHENMYFILSGVCEIIREAILEKVTTKYGLSKVILCDNQDMGQLGSSNRFERHLWRLFQLKAGDYFSAGEDLTNTHIISNSVVKVLAIKKLIVRKCGHEADMISLGEKLQAKLPSTQQLFKQYMISREWHKYRTSVTQECKGSLGRIIKKQ